jgi:hypothetical protein
MKTKIWILLISIFLVQICLASALTIGSVTSSPEKVQPGGKISLSLEIRNDLEEDISSVAVTLNLNVISSATGQVISTIPFAPYQSSNEDRVGDIDEDDEKQANFDLIAFSDATSGTYTIPVTATYTLDNGTVVQDEPLGMITLIVNAKPNIVISSEEPSLIKGTSGKITIMIVNSGLGSSKFLTVGINPANGITITSPHEVYIGNIDSNDFDTADFNVFVSANAPSTISLPVTVTYADSQNNQVTEEQTVFIKTYTQKEAISLGLIRGNNTALIIGFVVLTAVIFLIYRRIRKRARNKRSGE